MTHILRAHGLLATAIEAVGRMQANLVDDLRGPDGDAAWAKLRDVDALCNLLGRNRLLWNENRLLLREAVIARKAALNLVGATALEQRVMDECDKILELTK